MRDRDRIHYESKIERKEERGNNGTKTKTKKRNGEQRVWREKKESGGKEKVNPRRKIEWAYWIAQLPVDFDSWRFLCRLWPWLLSGRLPGTL